MPANASLLDCSDRLCKQPGPQLIFGTSQSAFGTPGAGGSFGFADPDSRLGSAYVMNNMDYYMFDDPRERRCATRCTARSGGSSEPLERRPEREGRQNPCDLAPARPVRPNRLRRRLALDDA